MTVGGIEIDFKYAPKSFKIEFYRGDNTIE